MLTCNFCSIEILTTSIVNCAGKQRGMNCTLIKRSEKVCTVYPQDKNRQTLMAFVYQSKLTGIC